MPFPASTPLRLPVFLPLALLALAGAACDSGSSSRSITAPSPPPEAPSPTLDASYSIEAALRVDSASAACGWGSPFTSYRSEWHAVVIGEAITLDDDPDPINASRYSGTLTGRAFIAKSELGGSVPSCQLREQWISGTFSDDFSSFEAYNTFVYGPPEGQVTVEWRVSARRI